MATSLSILNTDFQNSFTAGKRSKFPTVVLVNV